MIPEVSTERTQYFTKKDQSEKVHEIGFSLVILSDTTLLLWAEKTREQNTCKSDLNRIMTERPNICYIFEKLSVQGCQIWHSHVSMPFNSAPAHSTRPHNAKKSSLRYHFSRNSWKFGSQKLLHQGHFWWRGNFFFFSLPSGPRGMFEPNSHK